MKDGYGSGTRSGQGSRIMFVYPSRPEVVASTLEISVRQLRQLVPQCEWVLWKDVPAHGQEIFPRVASEVSGSATVVAEVTSLNMNVAFEIAYAIGQGIPLVPIRDVTFDVDGSSNLKVLGWLDSLGCVDYRNSGDLTAKLRRRVPVHRPRLSDEPVPKAGLILFDSPHASEGRVQLGRALDRAGISSSSVHRIRSLTSLVTAMRGRSGVVAHMIDERRVGASAHNVRAIFLTGLAVGMGKPVLLLQEGTRKHPVDYADLVVEYHDPTAIHFLVTSFLSTVSEWQVDRTRTTTLGCRISDLKDLFVLEEDPAEGSLREQFAAHLGIRIDELPGVWATLCDPLVDGEASFAFVLRRSLPGRSIASSLVREAAVRALAQGRDRIHEEDLLAADRSVSQAAVHELANSWETSRAADSTDTFLEALSSLEDGMSPGTVVARAAALGLSESGALSLMSQAISQGALQLWDCRLADDVAKAGRVNEPQLGSYDILHLAGWILTIHPALHSALKVRTSTASITPPIWSIG